MGIAIASGAYAISFGAISTAAGLSLLQTCALSILMFTGASQFAMVGVIGAGGSVGRALPPPLFSVPATPFMGCACRRC